MDPILSNARINTADKNEHINRHTHNSRTVSEGRCGLQWRVVRSRVSGRYGLQWRAVRSRVSGRWWPNASLSKQPQVGSGVGPVRR